MDYAASRVEALLWELRIDLYHEQGQWRKGARSVLDYLCLLLNQWRNVLLPHTPSFKALIDDINNALRLLTGKDDKGRALKVHRLSARLFALLEQFAARYLGNPTNLVLEMVKCVGGDVFREWLFGFFKSFSALYNCMRRIEPENKLWEFSLEQGLVILEKLKLVLGS